MHQRSLITLLTAVFVTANAKQTFPVAAGLNQKCLADKLWDGFYRNLS